MNHRERAFCGGEAGYLEALGIYVRSIEEKADGIERSLAGGDIDAYTIAVHSLKSTSRTVGAAEVSELAQALERAGNDGDIEAIRTDTPRLLRLYRSLKAPLETILGLHGSAEEGALPPLPEAEFAEALRSIRDMSAAFDYESVSMVMDMLAGYSIPEPCRAAYEKLRTAVGRCDWYAIAAALAECMNE